MPYITEAAAPILIIDVDIAGPLFGRGSARLLQSMNENGRRDEL